MKQTHQAIEGQFTEIGSRRKLTRDSHISRQESNNFTVHDDDDMNTKESHVETSKPGAPVSVLPSLELETSDVADLGSMIDKLSPQTNMTFESGGSSPHFSFASGGSLGYMQNMNGHNSTNKNIAGIIT
jgi:hypothetical protein